MKKFRFSELEWSKPIERTSVVLGGIGGIGSWIALLLARSDVKEIGIYEDDVVDAVNLGGQFYGKNNLNELKYEALVENLNLFANPLNSTILPLGVLIAERDKFYKKLNPLITFSAFDSISARKCLFNNWLELNTNEHKIFIDGRMGAENFQVYTVTNNEEDINKYKETLFSDDDKEAEEECTRRSTTQNGMMCAITMFSIALNHLLTIQDPKNKSYTFLTIGSTSDILIIKSNNPL